MLAATFDVEWFLDGTIAAGVGGGGAVTRRGGFLAMYVAIGAGVVQWVLTSREPPSPSFQF